MCTGILRQTIKTSDDLIGVLTAYGDWVWVGVKCRIRDIRKGCGSCIGEVKRSIGSWTEACRFRRMSDGSLSTLASEHSFELRSSVIWSEFRVLKLGIKTPGGGDDVRNVPEHWLTFNM
jgi:hypothetical protein